jgi:hypothetical protein
VGLAQSLVEPESYDTLTIHGLAQALERFFEMLALVTNLDQTDGLEALTQADRDFYRNLIRTWTSALRGYGKDSFESYNLIFVRDRLLQHRMTAHRAAINTGMERSAATVKAALEVVWSTNKPLNFTEIMQELLHWERGDRELDTAAANKRMHIRDPTTVRTVGKQAGVTTSATTGVGSSGTAPNPGTACQSGVGQPQRTDPLPPE